MANSIKQFYSGKSVFLTGGSGYVGKQLIEKLLRSCPAVDQINVLIRSKKDLTPNKRLEQVFDSPVFNRLKAENPGFRRKIRAISGDILLPGLGISDRDLAHIQDKSSIFIHSAASLNFAEPIRDAVKSNILPTKMLLEIAKETKNVDAFVYISTAYSQIDKRTIEEKIYDPPLEYEKLISLLDVLDDKQLKLITPTLIGKRPNTYTFTKSIAEKMVEQYKGDLPLAIVRPSIVTASFKEPFTAWIDNYTAATGIFVGCGLGMIRHMSGVPSSLIDLFPVDMVANFILAAGHQTALDKKNGSLLKVYNLASGGLNPFTISHSYVCITNSTRRDPSAHNIGGKSLVKITDNWWLKFYDRQIRIKFNAQVADAYLRLLGHKPRAVQSEKLFAKLEKVLEYFVSNDWDWKYDNYLKLMDSLSPADRKEFDFDVRQIKWEPYFDDYWIGIKRYLLKDFSGLAKMEETTDSSQKINPAPALKST